MPKINNKNPAVQLLNLKREHAENLRKIRDLAIDASVTAMNIAWITVYNNFNHIDDMIKEIYRLLPEMRECESTIEIYELLYKQGYNNMPTKESLGNLHQNLASILPID